MMICSACGSRAARCNDQWFTPFGFEQKLKQFTFSLGFRHFANTAGEDIGGTGTNITCSRFIREVKKKVQGGIAYTTIGRGIHYQFLLGKVFKGRNTGSALSFVLSADIPVGTRIPK
jgi:hypothetical protein